MYRSLLNTLILVAALYSTVNADWNYKRSDATYGPSMWVKTFPGCGGAKNSPINIDPLATVQKEAEKWKLTNWDQSLKFTVTDFKFKIGFALEDGVEVTSAGGTLDNTYKLISFHLHWGSANAHGSEHTVGGKAYPMETHFVHINSKFANMSAAAESGEDDAFIVLGFFFQIQDDKNADLDQILSAITAARAESGTPAAPLVKRGFNFGPLTTFTAESMQGNFYRYYGGLTTPGCNEQVKWTLFENPIGISADQMSYIRTQSQEIYDQFGTEYYRDVRPLGDRKVVLYHSAASQTRALFGILVLPLLAIILY